MPRPQPIQDRAAYVAYRLAGGLARTLPNRAGDAAARAAGRALSRALPGRRRIVRRNLQRVTGGALRGAALERAVGDAFASYGRYWLELFRLPSEPEHVVEGITVAGFEHFEEAVAAGKGVILALPHLGGWEAAGLWMTSRGHSLTVVVEPLSPPELHDWFVGLRHDLGMEVVPLGPDVVARALTTLRGGGILCLLSDRDLTGDGVPVCFFGEETTLPAGPATLALRTGAAILPAAVYFRPDGGHHAVVRPPLDTTRHGRLREDVGALTQQLAGELETLIAAAPEQWHLMQPNWPSDDPDRSAGTEALAG